MREAVVNSARTERICGNLGLKGGLIKRTQVALTERKIHRTSLLGCVKVA